MWVHRGLFADTIRPQRLTPGNIIPHMQRIAMPAPLSKPITRNRIRQSLCRWCFDAIPLETLAAQASAMGYQAMDLVDPAEWPILRRHNMICSMTPTHPLTHGLNDV